MKTAALISLGLFVLAGCASGPARAPRALVPPPDAAPIVAGQKAKDTTILAKADQIDGAVKGTAAEPAVNQATGEQRAAVAAAPAADVARLRDDYEATIRSLNAANAGLTAANDKLIKENAQLKDAAARETVGMLRRIGLGCLGLALVVGYLGFSYVPPLRPWAFVLFGLGVLCLAFAQLWAYITAQWWFMPLTGATAVAILAAIALAAWNSFKHGTLARDAADAAEQTGDTLKVLVGAVEEGKKTLGKAAPISALLDLIQKRSDAAHREVIEDTVRDLKTPASAAN